MPCIPPAGRGSRAIGLAVIAACLISVAAALAAPGTAQAHAGLERSDPPPNAIVPEAPATVTMTFTEPLEWSYTRAELYDESGEAVPGASSGPGATGYDMVLELPPTLPDGTYTVLWRTLSTADGHTARNSFAFTVGSDADVAAVAIPAADADAGPSGWAHAVTRWVALVGLAGSVAAWPVWMFVVRPGLAPAWRHAGRSCRAARRFAGAALGLAMAGNLAALAVQASMLDESLPGAIATTLADTRYGELWLMRVALLGLLALLLWSVAWWRPYRRPVRAALAFAVALALPVPFSLIAHASAQETGRDVAVFNDYLHLTAASLWAGGLAMVLAVSLPVARGSTATGAALAATLRRFSTMALVAWGVMVLSGLYSAWLQVGGWDVLVETGYGRRLLLKLALLAPILGLAAFNLAVVTRRVSEPDTAGRWARRFARSVGTEVALAVAVLLVVGSLTSTAPARGAAPPAGARVTAALASTGVEASLTVSPGEPGPNRLELVIEGSLPDGTEALLRVEHRDRDTGEKEIALDATGEGRYVAEGSELSLPGTWDLELILRPPGAIEQRLYGEVDIARVAPEIDPEAPGPAWVLASPRAVAGMLVVTSGGAAGVLGARHLRGRAGGLAITVATLALAIGGVLLALARQGG